MSEHDGPGSAAPPSPGPAGWYPDPWAQAAQRWFDGTQWTPGTQGVAQGAARPTTGWGAQPSGAPMGGGWGGGGPVPPAKKSRVGLIVAVCVAGVVVVLAGLGTAAYFAFKDEASLAQPGDCIHMTGIGTPNVNARQVDCESPNAINKVAVRIERLNAMCPNDNYDVYYEDTVGDFTLCMTLNARAGECFLGAETETSRIPCQRRPAADGFAFRVDRVLDGVDTPANCRSASPGSEGVSYPRPAMTLCIVALEPL